MRQRGELEARVLAGQSVGAIAGRCGLAADAVEAYVELFFAVRDRLGARDYILAVAIGLTPYAGLADDDIGSLLKRYAYMGGPLVLDALIEALGPGEAGRAGAKSAATGAEQIARSIRMAVLARAIPVDERTSPGVLRLHARLMEVEREVAANRAASRHIRATFEPLPGLASGKTTCHPAQEAGVDAGGGPRGGSVGQFDLGADADDVGSPMMAPVRIEFPVRRTA